MGAEGPRKMSVIIPGLNVNSERSPVHSIKDQRSLLKRWQKPKLENVIQLRNKDAVWNDVSKIFDLNFSGLMPRASRRNFQLIHADKPLNLRNPAQSSIVPQRKRWMRPALTAGQYLA
ncbi:hypothetical protein MHYP_G00059520 [Metynnis hypsauchen]